jgi:hypothetical protein
MEDGMVLHWGLWTIGLVVAAALGSPAGGAPPQTAKLSVTELSLEVTALQTLHSLKATARQLEALRELAQGTAAKVPEAGEVKASDEYRKLLADLRQALADALDEDLIDKLIEQLDELRAEEKPELHDDVHVTDQARRKAPEALRLFTARQVTVFAAGYGDEIGDPLEQLQEALNKARGVKQDQWKDYREEVADEVAWLVGGVDAAKAGRINDEVLEWLILVRNMKGDEFNKRKADLENKARQIVGDLGPTEVLRHFLEHAFAELLSNPRLAAVLQARTK